MMAAADGQPAALTAAMARNRAARSMVQNARSRQDGPTAAAAQSSHWVGVFNGWESVDSDLMRVIHGSGNEFRGIPTYHHVKNSGATFVIGQTLVRIAQNGASLFCEGVVIGDPTLMPAITPIPIPDPSIPAVSGGTSRSHMIGTFFAPGTGGGSNLTWDQTRYDLEQYQMNAIQMSDVIIQYTIDGTTAYYSTSNSFYTVSQDMVGRVIEANKTNGSIGKIWLGLATPVYWDWYSNAGNSTYVSNLLAQQYAIADELASLHGRDIIGFFAPQETDDALLSDSAKSAGAKTYYSSLASHVHGLGFRLMTAPFYLGLRLDPAGFATAVNSVFGASGIDILAVQDGLGSGSVSQAQAVQYYAALQSALAGTGIILAADHDMFDNNNSGGPMASAQLQSNIKALAPYVSSAYGFSFPSQMGPTDLGTYSVYNAYSSYLTTGG